MTGNELQVNTKTWMHCKIIRRVKKNQQTCSMIPNLLCSGKCKLIYHDVKQISSCLVMDVGEGQQGRSPKEHKETTFRSAYGHCHGAGVKTCWTAYFSCMQVICVSYALIKIFKQVTKDQYKSGLQVSLPLLHKGYFISCLWISLASLVSTSHSSLAGQVAGDRNNLLSTLAKVLLGNQVLPCTTNAFEWVTLLLWVCFFICETKVCQPFKQTSAREAVSLFVNWVLAAYWCVTCFCKASGFLFCVARVQT